MRFLSNELFDAKHCDHPLGRRWSFVSGLTRPHETTSDFRLVNADYLQQTNLVIMHKIECKLAHEKGRLTLMPSESKCLHELLALSAMQLGPEVVGEFQLKRHPSHQNTMKQKNNQLLQHLSSTRAANTRSWRKWCRKVSWKCGPLVIDDYRPSKTLVI